LTFSFARGYGGLKRSISLCISLVIYFSLTAASEANHDLNELLQKAKEERLYEDRQWQILLHYKPAGSGHKSLIDDPIFFLSPVGKEDSEAELEATLRAFFESDKSGDGHPRCRFAARFEWLREKLGIDESLFSDVACNELENILRTVQPRSAVLVFPAAFMNNPASMFGHTLLRIDGSYESKLLSFAANYAADPGTMGILYPFKGIFGFYKGYFNLFPYYDRIKMYNDTEQRDMWEYKLNLTEDEVRRMFLHLWELREIYSYYYFFDENCSYNLMFLLEAARPSIHLTDKFGTWVVPVDTIRAVEESGIVEGFEFRPAKATRIRYISSLLDDKNKKKALSIAENRLSPSELSDSAKEDKVKMLDLATEIIQYRYFKGTLSKDEYQMLFLAALKERSQLGTSDDPYQIPVPTPPEKGHLSNRLGLGIGVMDGRLFQDISIRPAYHSLMDPDEGYLDGSQIVFANTQIRSIADGRIRLERFDFIDIASVTPRDRFFKPLSFKIKTGFMQQINPYRDENIIYYFEPGIGVAFKNKYMGVYFIMAEASLDISGEYIDNYALGGGLWVGMIKKITDAWKINLSAETLPHTFGEEFQENRASAVQTFRLNQNNSLNLSISWEEIFHDNRTELELNWNYYF